eukprot:Sdes_comp20747_c0_seq1m16648
MKNPPGNVDIFADPIILFGRKKPQMRHLISPHGLSSPTVPNCTVARNIRQRLKMPQAAQMNALQLTRVARFNGGGLPGAGRRPAEHDFDAGKITSGKGNSKRSPFHHIFGSNSRGALRRISRSLQPRAAFLVQRNIGGSVSRHTPAALTIHHIPVQTTALAPLRFWPGFRRSPQRKLHRGHLLDIHGQMRMLERGRIRNQPPLLLPKGPDKFPRARPQAHFPIIRCGHQRPIKLHKPHRNNGLQMSPPLEQQRGPTSDAVFGQDGGRATARRCTQRYPAGCIQASKMRATAEGGNVVDADESISVAHRKQRISRVGAHTNSTFSSHFCRPKFPHNQASVGVPKLHISIAATGDQNRQIRFHLEIRIQLLLLHKQLHPKVQKQNRFNHFGTAHITILPRLALHRAGEHLALNLPRIHTSQCNLPIIASGSDNVEPGGIGERNDIILVQIFPSKIFKQREKRVRLPQVLMQRERAIPARRKNHLAVIRYRKTQSGYFSLSFFQQLVKTTPITVVPHFDFPRSRSCQQSPASIIKYHRGNLIVPVHLLELERKSPRLQIPNTNYRSVTATHHLLKTTVVEGRSERLHVALHIHLDSGLVPRSPHGYFRAPQEEGFV